MTTTPQESPIPAKEPTPDEPFSEPTAPEPPTPDMPPTQEPDLGRDREGTPEDEENQHFNEEAEAARQAAEQGAALRGFVR
jgi:hypothetical protein